MRTSSVVATLLLGACTDLEMQAPTLHRHWRVEAANGSAVLDGATISFGDSGDTYGCAAGHRYLTSVTSNWSKARSFGRFKTGGYFDPTLFGGCQKDVGGAEQLMALLRECEAGGCSYVETGRTLILTDRKGREVMLAKVPGNVLDDS